MPYFILTVFDTNISRYVVLFGDYDPEVVGQEKSDEKEHDYDRDYRDWSVTRLPNDLQATIDEHMWILNKPVSA